MNQPSDGELSGQELEGFVQGLHGKGVRLWVEESALRYHAPKGVLTSTERQILSHANGSIASLLQSCSWSSAVLNPVSRHPPVRRAPLSFTQLEHWNERREHGGRPARQVALAARLVGQLQIDLINESIQTAGRRHDALRTQIVYFDDMTRLQEVSEEYRSELEIIPLSSIPALHRATEVEQQINHVILDANDYSVSPLFKAVLLSIDKQEHVLILALDHIISDFVSLNILSGEIMTGYGQLLEGRSVDLPRVLMQYPDYAARQRAHCTSFAAGLHGPFESTERTRFPDDLSSESVRLRTGWGLARCVIGRDLRNQLCEWARRHGTTIVIATLAAYSALVLRWCGVRETVIPFMTAGRISAEVQRTVGYFAFPIYVRVVLERRDTFLDVVKHVIEEYCRACDAADFGYALSQSPRPEYTCNTVFNWLPTAGTTGGADESRADGALKWSRIEFPHPLLESLHLNSEPSIVFADRDGVITGDVSYPRYRFYDGTMQKFVANVSAFLTSLVTEPGRFVMDMHLT